MKILICCFFALFVNIMNVNALIFETDSDQIDTVKINSFKLSLSTGNNSVEKGKKKTNSVLYLKPALEYGFKEHVYVSLSCDYYPSYKTNSIDNALIGIRYDTELFKNISSSVGYTYTRYFSKKEILSAEPHDFEGSLEWSNDIVTPSLNLSYLFGKGVHDFSIAMELSHSFSIEHVFSKTDNLSFPVSVSTTFATANGYQEYFKNNKVVITKKNGKNSSSKLIDYTSINPSFALEDITPSVGISYSVGGLSIGTIASYYIPFNEPVDLINVENLIIEASLSFSF